ncbi:MAG: hypothetical protein ACYTGL_31155 [Planctomycetota bacterium]
MKDFVKQTTAAAVTGGFLFVSGCGGGVEDSYETLPENDPTMNDTETDSMTAETPDQNINTELDPTTQ